MTERKLYENRLKHIVVDAGTDIKTALQSAYFDYLKDEIPRHFCFNGVNVIIF